MDIVLFIENISQIMYNNRSLFLYERTSLKNKEN